MASQKGDWRDGFLFLGNNLALDFLNTRPVMDGRETELIPDFPALLRWFVAAEILSAREVRGFADGPTAAQAKVLQEVREFRERLRVEIAKWERTGKISPAWINELNHQLAKHPMRTRLLQGGQKLSLDEYVSVQAPSDLIAPLVSASAHLLANADPTRVRQCDACVLHFLDTSKKGTRRWCSMQICGNREKVAAYASRQRQNNSK